MMTSEEEEYKLSIDDYSAEDLACIHPSAGRDLSEIDGHISQERGNFGPLIEGFEDGWIRTDPHLPHPGEGVCIPIAPFKYRTENEFGSELEIEMVVAESSIRREQRWVFVSKTSLFHSQGQKIGHRATAGLVFNAGLDDFHEMVMEGEDWRSMFDKIDRLYGRETLSSRHHSPEAFFLRAGKTKSEFALVDGQFCISEEEGDFRVMPRPGSHLCSLYESWTWVRTWNIADVFGGADNARFEMRDDNGRPDVTLHFKYPQTVLNAFDLPEPLEHRLLVEGL